jgi:hypothetical protein
VKSPPAFSLADIKALVQRGAWRVTSSAGASARALDLDESDIKDCLLALTAADFHKSDASTDNPGRMLDVYHTKFGAHWLYVKLQVQKTIAGGTVVVVSFRQK